MSRPNLLRDIWNGYRPYAVCISVDLLISASLWLVLFVFKWLTRRLAVEGWAGEFIVAIHSAGAVGAFLVFGFLFAVDLYRLHRTHSHV